jgi:cell wall-associated NlpC family hydrolase
MRKRKRNIMLLTLLLIGSFTFLLRIQAAATNIIHTVSSTETVESIASKYHITVEQLMKTNGLPNAALYAGQKLQILYTPYTSSQYQWEERGKQIANYAKTFVGFTKTMGGESPDTGFDSSGLIYWVLAQERLPIDRLTLDGFYKLGMDTDTPKAGDIIFFVEKDSTGNVTKIVTGGIYLGNDQFVHSGIGSSTVQIKSRTDKSFAPYSVVYKTYTPKGEHIVQQGETLQSISTKYGISIVTLKNQNGLPSDTVLPGQYLQVYSTPLFPFYSSTSSSYNKAYDVIKYAYTLRGFSYVWGQENPVEGMDCSGFVYWVMKQQGFPIKRETAAGYYTLLPKLTEPKAGDLVFFSNTGKRIGITHMGIYIGNGRFIHTTEKAGVHISLLSSAYYAEKFHSYSDIKTILD